MSSDWNRVREIVESALDLPAEERETFVRSTCGDDANLLDEVLSWLRSAEQAVEQEFLGGPEESTGTEPSAPPRSSGPPRVGSHIGDLMLVGILGQGQQGIVYDGLQRGLNRRVAVKVLVPARDPEATQTDRFLREAEAAARLHHPNVVQVHDILEHDGHHLIVQELVDGRSLEAILKERLAGEPSIDEAGCRWAAAMCEQLARGLQHAHEHQVVHRDVKPSNVLVTSDEIPKLSDFGLALMQDQLGLTQTGAMLGTPHYMSPEQIEGHQESLDARTDVWALGAILYRMLTAQMPFRGKTLQSLFRDILGRAPQAPTGAQPAVSRDLEAVCLKCLEKDPEDRYQSADELADDLERFLAGQATVARPLGPIGTAYRAVQRLAVSTLAVVVLLIPVIWFAVDMVWRPLPGEGTLAVHTQRLVFLAGAVLLTVLPAALLAQRLARGRRLVAVVAVLLVVGLGALGGALIRGERETLRHAQARETLRRAISQPDGRGTGAIDNYVSDWHDDLDTLDMQLIARGYLLAKRGSLAQEWTDRAVQDDPANPLTLALDFVMKDVFGNAGDAASAEALLWESEQSVRSWRIWMNVGEILRTSRHFGRAQAAYRIAQKDLDAPQHRLNPGLARISLDLCQYEQAERDLSGTLERLPDDPRVRFEASRIACRTAIGKGDWEAAADHLAEFEANDLSSRLGVHELRFTMLQAQGDAEAATALLRSTSDLDDVTPAELEWCGKSAAVLGDYETMNQLFERLVSIEPELVSGYVGLSGSLIGKGFTTGTLEDKKVWTLEAVEHAQKAIELDEDYFESWGNLAKARELMAYIEYGYPGNAPASDMRAILDPMRKALARDSLEPNALNSMAQGLVFLYEHEPDPAHLDEALGYVRRSIRLSVAPPGSACGSSPDLHYIYDTERHLHEQLGDDDSALESARHAATAAEESGADEEKLAERLAHVKRLAGG